MPPKRKRADDPAPDSEAASTRATRSSARLSNGATSTTVSSKSAVSKKVPLTKVQQDIEATPPVKKVKTKNVSKPASKPAGKGRAKLPVGVDAVSPSIGADDGTTPNHDDAPGGNKGNIGQASTSSAVAAKPVSPLKSSSSIKTHPPIPSEPYTPQRSLALFKSYADNDNPDVIGPEGYERLCTDANFPLDGALPLILAWQLGSKEMASITKDEWMSGTELLRISSLSLLSVAMHDLDNYLMLEKAAPKKSAKKDPYDRTTFWSYCDNKKLAFQKFYTFCFVLAKPEHSRNIDMETASALWSVLLVPKFPIVGEVLSFINEKGSFKACNKDLWNMMLEFCETVSPNLSNYEGDGAWPTLLDDFVSWKKGATVNNGDENPII